MLCFHVSGGFELEGGDADSEPSGSRRRRSEVRTFSPWQFTAWLTLSNTCFPPHAGVKAPHNLLSVPLIKGGQEGQVRWPEAGNQARPFF